MLLHWKVINLLIDTLVNWLQCCLTRVAAIGSQWLRGLRVLNAALCFTGIVTCTRGRAIETSLLRGRWVARRTRVLCGSTLRGVGSWIARGGRGRCTRTRTATTTDDFGAVDAGCGDNERGTEAEEHCACFARWFLTALELGIGLPLLGHAATSSEPQYDADGRECTAHCVESDGDCKVTHDDWWWCCYFEVIWLVQQQSFFMWQCDSKSELIRNYLKCHHLSSSSVNTTSN